MCTAAHEPVRVCRPCTTPTTPTTPTTRTTPTPPGITEAFVHAVLDEAALKAANALLVLFTAAHIACSVALVQLGGAAGLVAADTLTMALRIAYSLW
jgi:hypothetical protein